VAENGENLSSPLVSACHHPRKQATTLVFEGGCSLPTPPPLPTLENEQPRSFLRAVALLQHQHHHPPSKTSHRARFQGWLLSANTTTTTNPRKRATTLVFEGGCSLPTPTPPSTLENEQPRSFSRAVALCHHHHHHPFSKTSTFAHFRGYFQFFYMYYNYLMDNIINYIYLYNNIIIINYYL
jgi:hypothetical protein